MDSHQMRQIDLGVDLSCREGAVAEELLDRSKIHSRLQKMGGERVPQRMRVKMIEIGGSADRVVELTADRAVAEATPALVDEQRVSLAGDTSPPAGAFGKIELDGLRRWPAKGHEALLAPLAAHPDQPLTELDVAEVESYELPDAEPRGVKELYRRPVAAPGGSVRKTLEKLLDGVAIGNLRSSLDVVGVGHGICRARLESALGNQEAEVRPESGQGACDRSRLETSRVEMGEMSAHRHGRGLRRPFLVEFRGDEFDKGEDLAAIGAERRRREIAFPLEVLQKCVDHPGSEVAFTGAGAHFSPIGMVASLPRALHHHSRRASPNISPECFTAITLDAST
jgi:hypothetical protein